MFELFGFDACGRKDFSNALMPTEMGYHCLEEQLRNLVKSGHAPWGLKDDDDVKRLAMSKGKTVEEFLKYDLGVF